MPESMNSNAKTIDDYLKDLPDWQKQNLKLFRKTVHAVIPDIKEEIKWGVPVFVSDSKMLFTMASFKEHTKYNFMYNGAFLDDSAGLFNGGLDSKKSRSIDLREDQHVDIGKLEVLIRQAYRNI